MKKFLSILLAVVMAFGCVGTVFAETVDGFEPIVITPAPVSENDIKIIYTNDAHCCYENYDRVATLAKDADLLIDGGDALDGGLVGALSSGEYIIEIMNELGYDLSAVGNHDFAYGVDQLKSLASKAKFKYVCCNFKNVNSNETVFEPYEIFEVKGTKIAFVGATTPLTLQQVMPTYFKDSLGNYVYSFCEGNKGQDFYNTVQKSIDDAKLKADYVILVSHLGTTESASPYSIQETVANTKGIDAVLDSHSHTVYTSTFTDKDNKEIIAIQTGTGLVNAGELIIKADGTITAKNIELTNVEPDASMTKILKGISSKIDAVKNKVVAKTDVDLTIKYNGKRAIRNSETNLGDLCADAYRKVLDSDIAFVNGGGIRADIVQGNITYEDIINVFPFNNTACLVEVSGRQIKDALELGCSAMPSESGGFLQVSGITYTVDATKPSKVVKDNAGNFVKVDGEYRVRDIMIGGKPIELNRTYTLAAHNFMLKSAGDGYAMFGLDNVKIIQDEVMLDNQLLIQYITENLGGVIGAQYKDSQGRVKFIVDADECAKNSSCSMYMFVDLDLTKWYHDGIHFCLDEGIMNGVANTVFNPNGSCTRGMLAAILYRVEGSPETEVTTMFTDIRGSEYYAKAVSWAFNNNVVNGLEPHTFGGSMNITREQFATMLYNYAKLNGEGFVGDWYFMLDYEDASQIHSWADEAMHWCVMKKILNGKSETILDPQGLLTRAEAAAMIQRYCYLQ